MSVNIKDIVIYSIIKRVLKRKLLDQEKTNMGLY